ncbi:MAG: DUF2141 domain-containing protein [Pseudomonadota bacterium]|nr:DUF2141 domain-containing protein [Pseudomonadota bacterium]
MMFSALTLAAALGAAASDEASLTVQVEGLETPQGAVMMALFDAPDAWDGGEAVAGQRVAVDGESVTIEFGALPAGEYAIRMFHDVDGDGELDMNLMGIPSEPFGFSNNARGRFGPASWEDAVFTLAPGENTHALDLR